MLDLKENDVKKLRQETLINILADAAKEELPIFKELLSKHSPLKVVKNDESSSKISILTEVFDIVGERNNDSDVTMLIDKMHSDFAKVSASTANGSGKECLVKLDHVLLKLLLAKRFNSLDCLLDFCTQLETEQNQVLVDGKKLNYSLKLSRDTLYVRDQDWVGSLFNALLIFAPPEKIKRYLPVISESNLFGNYYDSSVFSKNLEVANEIRESIEKSETPNKESIEKNEQALNGLLNYFEVKGFKELPSEEKISLLTILGLSVGSPKIEQILFVVNPQIEQKIKDSLGVQVLESCFISKGSSISVNTAFERWKAIGHTSSYGYIDIIENFVKKTDYELSSDEREFKRRILKSLKVDGESAVRQNKLTFLQSFLHKETPAEVFVRLRGILEELEAGLFLKCVEAKSLIPQEFKSRKQTDFLGYCAIVGNIDVATWLLKEYPKYPKTEARNLSKYLAKRQKDGSATVNNNNNSSSKVISNFEALLLEHKVKTFEQKEAAEEKVIKKSFRL